MSNQNNNATLRISSKEAEVIVSTIVSMVLWANEGGDPEYAKRIIGNATAGITTWANMFQVRPLVAEKLQEARLKDMLSAKADDASVHDLECELFRNDWECESFRSMWSGPEATADRAVAKDATIEEKDGKNRALMNQARAYRDMTSDKVLYMEFLCDQYKLGLIERAFVRRYLTSTYRHCERMLKGLRWVQRPGQGVRGLVKGCGYSVTALKAMANVAIDLLEEIGYKLELMPSNFQVRRDSKQTVVTWECNHQERQEHTGDDWNQGVHEAFYQQLDD